MPDVRTPVPLRTLHGIELAAIGTWKASTGETTFTSADFTNAVAALECPGVRNPVIKLGHDEADSTSGVRWDGEPAVGWVADMRFDGAKMLGDFTGMPAWLADADENGLSVLAAAYPDRSIEIWRPFVCQIGHEHPAVITAVSLLGVYPPGVGVLKSMQDVYAAFTTEPAKLSTTVAMAGRLDVAVRLAAAEREPVVLRREPTKVEAAAGTDFVAMQTAWEDELEALLEQWQDEIDPEAREELLARIEELTESGAYDQLGALAITTALVGAGSALIAGYMLTAAADAAAAMVAEAESQGVTPKPESIDADWLEQRAKTAADLLTTGLAQSAGREAANRAGPGAAPQEVRDGVRDHLDSLADRALRDQLGAALTAAQNAGRLSVMAGAEKATYYAVEILDASTCTECSDIDGTRFDSLAEATRAYATGGYISCLGRERCRGIVVAIWDGGDPKAEASAPTIGEAMPTKAPVVRASVSVEDISRKYYEAAGYNMWITAMHVDPLELIAADDANGKFYRIPVEMNGDEFTFGEPQEVAVVYEDVKAAAAAMPVRYGSRKVALAAAGKNEDGTDRVAGDVTPAGVAIRKVADKATATTTVETEVIAPPVDPTPDADPAAGPVTTPEEASVDAAKMREALGLKSDATDDEVRAAVAAQLTPPPADTDPLAALTANLPQGERPILVDPENYKSLLSMAVKGERAYAEVTKTRGKELLRQAAMEGRFPVSRLSVYEDMWEKNPEETEAYIKLMPKNTVPTLASGVFGQEISQNESDMAYEGLYGKAGA